MQLSSLGKKYVVAITGFLLFLFLIGHMVGNLLIYQGRDAINTYAEKLKATGPLLWGVRLGLLAVLLIHLYFTISLSLENNAARKCRYAKFQPKASTFSSRWMVWTGLVVLVFIVYHLSHFTMFLVHPEYGKYEEALKPDHTRHDVFQMVTTAFNKPLVVLLYVAAMAVVFVHLWHGVSSMFQTMGFSNERWSRIRERAAPIVVGLLILGFLAVPIGVKLGLIKSDPKEETRAEQPIRTAVHERDSGSR
jgi:succinate dehydrogenase / fumarate reductase, cytochrome b subunit